MAAMYGAPPVSAEEHARRAAEWEAWSALVNRCDASHEKHANARGTVALDALLGRVGSLDALVARVKKVPTRRRALTAVHERAWSLDGQIVWSGWWEADAGGEPVWREEWAT